MKVFPYLLIYDKSAVHYDAIVPTAAIDTLAAVRVDPEHLLMSPDAVPTCAAPCPVEDGSTPCPVEDATASPLVNDDETTTAVDGTSKPALLPQPKNVLIDKCSLVSPSPPLASPTPSKLIKMLALNVNGFISRCENGVLDAYLSNFEIICLSETKINQLPPNISKSLIGEYKYLHKQPTKCKYGGFHGLAAFVHPSLNATIIPDTTSEAVLWFNITTQAWSCVVGALYAPHENSIHRTADVFDDIALDVISLKDKFNCPMMILGDANAYTAIQNDGCDPLIIDNKFGHEFGLDLICQNEQLQEWPAQLAKRANADKRATNKNGKALIKLCQAVDLKIVNGRLGDDEGMGNLTYFEKNDDKEFVGIGTLDYCLANAMMWPLIKNFEVDTFDNMLSDKHAPILVTIEAKQTVSLPVNLSDIDGQHCDSNGSSSVDGPIFTKWSPDLATKMSQEFHKFDFKELSARCAMALDQSGINEIAQKFTEITIDAAKNVGACKPRKKCNPEKPAPYQPWFDETCHTEKRKYFMLKNHLKRDGKKSMANQASKTFKKFISTKRKEFYKQLNTKIKSMKHSSPREYWKILNGCAEGKKVKEKVSLEVFYEHFKNLSVTSQDETHSTPDGDLPPAPDPTLNEPITMDELRKFLTTSKNGKAT